MSEHAEKEYQCHPAACRDELIWRKEIEDARNNALELAAVEAEHCDRYGMNHLTIAARIRAIAKSLELVNPQEDSSPCQTPNLPRTP